MSLTKVQPSALDETLDYSVNKITVSGVNVLAYAQTAFSQANSAYAQANTGGGGGASVSTIYGLSIVFGNGL